MAALCDWLLFSADSTQRLAKGRTKWRVLSLLLVTRRARVVYDTAATSAHSSGNLVSSAILIRVLTCWNFTIDVNAISLLNFNRNDYRYAYSV